MSFPYANARGITITHLGLTGDASVSTALTLVVGMHNIAQLPDVVDVSAMEFSAAIAQNAATGAPVRFAVTGASTASFTFADGGPSGDATAAAVLVGATEWTNAAEKAFGSSASPNQPLDAAGTSTTDLDADDWFNLKVIANVTGAGGFGALHLNANYVYGKPGGIA